MNVPGSRPPRRFICGNAFLPSARHTHRAASAPLRGGYQIKFHPGDIAPIRRALDRLPGLREKDLLSLFDSLQHPPAFTAEEEREIARRRPTYQAFIRAMRPRAWVAEIITDRASLETWLHAAQARMETVLDTPTSDPLDTFPVAACSGIVESLTVGWYQCVRSGGPQSRRGPERLAIDLLRRNRELAARVRALAPSLPEGKIRGSMEFAAVLMEKATEMMAHRSVEAYQRVWQPETILAYAEFDAANASISALNSVPLVPSDIPNFICQVDNFCFQNPQRMLAQLEEIIEARSRAQPHKAEAWRRILLALPVNLVDRLVRLLKEDEGALTFLTPLGFENLIRFPFLMPAGVKIYARAYFAFHENAVSGVFTPLEERIIREMIRVGPNLPGITNERFRFRRQLAAACLADFLVHEKGVTFPEPQRMARFLDGDNLPRVLQLVRTLPFELRRLEASEQYDCAIDIPGFPEQDDLVRRGIAEFFGETTIDFISSKDLGDANRLWDRD